MNRIDNNKVLRSSILDRLIDDEPHVKLDGDKNRFQKNLELRESVRRDLENLLNTRFRLVSPPEDLLEVQDTVVNYGLPDLATVNITDIEQKKRFTSLLENTLRRFEPRFKNVNVVYMDNDENLDRTLRFRVNATLYADPAPESVIFDSVLEPVSRTVNVEESNHG